MQRNVNIANVAQAGDQLFREPVAVILNAHNVQVGGIVVTVVQFPREALDLVLYGGCVEYFGSVAHDRVKLGF